MSTTITGLPNATTPLSGTERVPMDQSGATKDATTQDIANLAPGTDLTFTQSTRVLASSTGADVTLPVATDALPGLMAAADKAKLDGVAAGAEVNVNADWNAGSGDAQILNKPTLGSAAAQNVGTSAGNVVALDGSGKLPAVDGSALTGLPPGITDLGYTASSRLLTSSTGADVTLPLFDTASSNAGLVPGSSTGGTTNFLRADGTWAAPPSSPPGGSTTQIQFNDGGAFGGDADLTYNKTTNLLTTKGDINLDDGGSFTTTLQTITPTANRTLSLPDATGTVALVAGSSGQPIYNNAGAYAGLSTATIGTTGNISLSLNGAASTPPVSFTGTWFTGGTGTTTKPQLLIEPAGTTSTAWSTSGTGLGVNAASGFAGNLLDLQVNGTSYLKVDNTGNITGSTINFQVRSPSTGNYVQIGNDVGLNNGNSGRNVFLNAGGGVHVVGDKPFGWGAAINTTAASMSLQLWSPASDTLEQRRGTNAQTSRVYDTFTSATDYHRIAIATARATLNNVTGASVTATGLIPAGAVVMGVTSKVTTGLGTSNGTTGYKIGTGADDDRWGAITGTAAGTTSDNRNWTAGTIECFPAATDVIVTATGGNFDGTGVIYLSVQYMTGQAD